MDFFTNFVLFCSLKSTVLCTGFAAPHLEQELDSSLAAMNIGSVHLNTSQLLGLVGPPPWNTTRVSSSSPSNLRPEICTRIKPVNASAYAYFKPPQSLIRLAQLEHVYPRLGSLPELVIGYNTSARHSLPISVNILSNILLRLASNSTAAGIALETHQLPFNTRTAASSAFSQNALQNLLASPLALIASLAGLLYLAFAASEIVAERQACLHLTYFIEYWMF